MAHPPLPAVGACEVFAQAAWPAHSFCNPDNPVGRGFTERMAFLTFSKKGVELGRWPLNGSIVIGRAADCDITIHDILLSRHHCRIERTDDGWVITDLGSKNGTRVGNERVERRTLKEGDVLTIGNMIVRFYRGKFVGTKPGPRATFGKRPVDPFEALSGTISGFDAKAVEEYQRENNLPTPQPMPPEPDAYAREDVYSMLTEIASSSWDSIYATASRPRRPLPAGAAPAAAKAQAANPITFRSSRQRADDRLQVAHAEHQGDAARLRPARPARPRRPDAPVAPEVPASVAAAPAAIGVTKRTLRAIGRVLEAVRKWFAPDGSVRLF
jgi:predicted component of type VI protein secretion system